MKYLVMMVVVAAFIVTAPNAESNVSLRLEEEEASPDTIGIRSKEEIREATSVWENYIEAVREGDREKAIGYWSEETRRRYPAFDFQMPDFDIAVARVNRDDLEIEHLEDQEDYIRLLAASRERKHTYYLIREDGRWCLANPIGLFTKGWRKRETESFVCHYKNGEAPTDRQCAELDRFFEEMSSSWNLTLDRKIDYYKCGSVQEVGKLFGMEPTVGRGHLINSVIAATQWTSYHEVVHALLGQVCRWQPTSLILEGTACYYGGTSLISREIQLSWAKTLVENEESMPITQIVDGEAFWSAKDMNDPYAEGASFVWFLADTYGIDKFREFYGYRDTIGDIEAAAEEIYGKDIGGLEKEWSEWLLRLDLPVVEAGDSDTAEELFSMQDPAYDDNGDGDYTYPQNIRYVPGMFDLTGFRVLAGEDRVYFELQYRDLVEWEGSEEWGFWGTYTRITIDCGEEGGSDFGRDSHATLSGRSDYLINVSDSGIIVWRGGRVVGLLKRNPHGNKLGDADSERICFSVPSSIMERPRDSWRYAVAVGGNGRRGRRFIDGAGTFLEVGKNSSEDTGGGGSDSAFNPNIYDILLPPGRDQAGILSAYDPEAERLAVLPMVGR